MNTLLANVIKELRPDQESLLEKHFHHWLALGKSTHPVDRTRLKLAIASAYSQVGLPPPSIIWCQSPWQMLAMPAVIELSLVCYKRSLAESDLGSMTDRHLWLQLLTDLERQGFPDGFAELTRQRSKEQEEITLHLLLLQMPAEDRARLRELWKNPSVLGFRTAPVLRSQLLDRWESAIKELRESSISDDLWSDIETRLVDRLESELNRPLVGHLRFDLQRHVLRMERVLERLIENAPQCPEFNPHLKLSTRPRWIEAGSSWAIARNWFSSYLLLAEVAGCNWLNELTAGRMARLLELDRGQFTAGVTDSNWLSQLMFERYADWLEIARAGFAYLFYERVCFICERPQSLATDDRGSLHHPSGPAMTFNDGYCLYSWHGISVPKDMITHPEWITVDRIENERNAELRRVLIDRYGPARYLHVSGAEKIHEDDFGILYKKNMHADEPLMLVKVVNSTAEPDGSYRDYFLRVPPDITTAREAVAWTFNLSDREYAPVKET